MQILWNKEIISTSLWEPEYEGDFCKIRDTVHFFFKEASAVAFLAENMSEPRKVYPGFENGPLPLPNQWILMEDADTKLLFLSEKLTLNLEDLTSFAPDQTFFAKYLAERKPEKYYVEAPFIHGEYCIAHKGQWGYECRKNGESIWEFKGQGYLYTDICRWNDRFYFGTAGQGGYFYVLSAETGEVVSAIKTGGTASIIRIENECYILSNEKSALLLRVDLRAGCIKEFIPLPGKAEVYSKLKAIDGKIHATTFEYKRNEMQYAVWNCIQI